MGMEGRGRKGLVLAVLTIAAVGSEPVEAQEAGPEGPLAGDLRVEEAWLATAEGDSVAARRGTLAVPESRGRADSRIIRLAFVRLLSTAPDPGPPLFYLAGGPGGSATASVSSPRGVSNWTWYLSYGDVVFLDQRGAGDSEPPLLFIQADAPEPDLFVDAAAARARAVALARAGAAHFRRLGVDLDAYTSVESADDIDALRGALGYPRINLFGFSYGTHLALATIRRHEAHVASAVLVGVEGPDHTFKLPHAMDAQFERLALLAARDPEVSRLEPDLVALLDRVLEKLARAPLVVRVNDPMGRVVDVPVGPFGLKWILRFDIGDRSDFTVFPRLLYSIDRGDPTLLAWFVQKRFPLVYGSNLMSLMVDAASGASPERLRLIASQAETSRFAEVVNFPNPEIGPDVAAPDLGNDYRGPLESSVRALFLSGTLDFNTPPHQAEEVRRGFSASTHITVRNAGHEQILPEPFVQDAIRAFLAGDPIEDATVDAGPIRFVPLEGYDPARTHPSVPRPR